MFANINKKSNILSEKAWDILQYALTQTKYLNLSSLIEFHNEKKNIVIWKLIINGKRCEHISEFNV